MRPRNFIADKRRYFYSDVKRKIIILNVAEKFDLHTENFCTLHLAIYGPSQKKVSKKRVHLNIIINYLNLIYTYIHKVRAHASFKVHVDIEQDRPCTGKNNSHDKFK